MKDKQPLTHRAKKAAKRLFKKLPHSTHPFSITDYNALIIMKQTKAAAAGGD